MRNLKIYGLILMAAGIFACAEDKSIGNIPELTGEYVLPQGHSSADDRIVEVFDKWGTYILYEYTDADLRWLQVDVNDQWNGYEYTDPDTLYVDEMMDFLQKAWFDFYPDSFHQAFMPKKVFLTSELKFVDDYMGELFYDAQMSGTQIVISHCNESLVEMTDAEKRVLKNQLQSALWGAWLNDFEIPEAFYEVSSYSMVASSNPSDWNYAREMGFIADEGGSEWSTMDPYPSTTLNKNWDLQSFLIALRNRTEEEWAEDLTYPLVKQKYDILRNYFQENFQFDIQKIGNATEF